MAPRAVLHSPGPSVHYVMYPDEENRLVGPFRSKRAAREAVDRANGIAVYCDEGGPTHTWEARGVDTNGAGELVNLRRCVRCDTYQEKRYGGGRAWREHTA